jgi:hypothetical protein
MATADPPEPGAESGSGPELDPEAMVARYDRLIAFQQAILKRMRRLQQQLPPSARLPVEDRDIKPLKGLIDQFRDRREHWRRKAEGVIDDDNQP